MKLRDLLQGISWTAATADLDMEIAGISYDSRKTQPGELFVAIHGYESDGHKFIPSAVDKGAVAVLCQDIPAEDVPYIQVENSRLALALASANWFGRPAGQLQMIGVTGTNGKTTSTTLIKSMLEQTLGAKVGLIGTNQNMIGDQVLDTERTTPESYELQQLFREMLDAGCTHVVMEVSSHALALDRVAGIPFVVGLFTNLTQDHLDFHKTMEAYAAAKAHLFTMCQRGAVNLDDPYAKTMIEAATCPILTYSTEKNEADLVAKDIKLRPDRVDFCALTMDALQRVRLHIPGQFSVYNALTVIACGLLLNIGLPEIAAALENCHGVKGRVEVVPTGKDYTILIDYAHTPDALENVLKAVQGFAQGRVVALFGCGGDRDRTKRPIMGQIAAQLADFVIVTSDNPRTEEPGAIITDILAGMQGSKTPYVVIEDRRAAIAYAMDHAQPGDIILLAGKGHETYQIVGKEKHHMDEREIVAEHLAGEKR